MSKENSIKGFEKNLSELETLVETLESGDLSLEDALSHFEKGVQKTQACQKALAEAEQRVKVLVEKNGDIEFNTFNLGENTE